MSDPTPPRPNENRVVKCDRCGEERPCAWTTDPFLAEIHPEDPNPPAWWCEECYAAQVFET